MHVGTATGGEKRRWSVKIMTVCFASARWSWFLLIRTIVATWSHRWATGMFTGAGSTSTAQRRLANGDIVGRTDLGKRCAHLCDYCGQKITQRVNIHRGIMAVYDADVVSVQQVREWCHDFVSGLGVMNEGRSGRPSASDSFVIDIEALVRADRHLWLKLLQLAFRVSRGGVWDTPWMLRLPQSAQKMSNQQKSGWMATSVTNLQGNWKR